jgi:TonB family protein
MDVGPAPGGREAIDLSVVIPDSREMTGGRRGRVFRIPASLARAWSDSLAAFFASDSTAPPVLRFARADRSAAGEALVVERQAIPGVPDSLVAFVVSIEAGRDKAAETMTFWRSETGGFVRLLRSYLRAFEPALIAEGVATLEPGKTVELEYPVQEAEQTCHPGYPKELRNRGVRGSAHVRFIVGVDGRVERGSVNVYKATDPAFADAVMRAIPCMRYVPAEHKGRRVRQMIDQPFTFEISR